MRKASCTSQLEIKKIYAENEEVREGYERKEVKTQITTLDQGISSNLRVLNVPSSASSAAMAHPLNRY
jgi:hypothetical protein